MADILPPSQGLEPTVLYCVCQQHDSGIMIECIRGSGGCHGWVHPKCCGLELTQSELEALDSYICPLCERPDDDFTKMKAMNTKRANKYVKRSRKRKKSSSSLSNNSSSSQTKIQRTTEKSDDKFMKKKPKSRIVEDFDDDDTEDDNPLDQLAILKDENGTTKLVRVKTLEPTANSAVKKKSSKKAESSSQSIKTNDLSSYPSSTSKQTWKCKACTLENVANATECEECFQGRYQVLETKSSSSSRGRRTRRENNKKKSYHVPASDDELYSGDDVTSKKKKKKKQRSASPVKQAEEDPETNAQQFVQEEPMTFNVTAEKVLGSRRILIEDKNQPIRAVTEYYVKWKNFSYLHASWEQEETLLSIDPANKNRIRRFNDKKAQRDFYRIPEEEDYFNPEYVEVHRILAERQETPIQDEPEESDQKDPEKKKIVDDGQRYLVKWRSLPYSECTWERACDLDNDTAIETFQRYEQVPPEKDWKPLPRPTIREYKKLEESPGFGKDGDLKLREYQLEGLNWLMWNWYNKRPSILADEMGLGKTIQTLAFINSLRMSKNIRNRGPYLIVAPLSLIQQWQNECETWTDMNCIVYHGNSASREILQEYEFHYHTNGKLDKKKPYRFHLLVTTYEIAIKDIRIFSRISWSCVIVDEAHRLKNQQSRLVEHLRSIKRDHCVLLTGTPLQNKTEELWALLNFLDSPSFPSIHSFLERFGDLQDATQVAELHKMLKPYLLRRVKEDVEKSLPPKEETIVEVELTPVQKQWYRAIYEKNTSFLYRGGNPSNAPNLMNVMMELRKCCNHPYLNNGVEDALVEGMTTEDDRHDMMVKCCGKLVLLDKLLPRLKENGHKLLIFSQMVRVLDILEDYLRYCGHSYERLDGNIRGNERQAAIDRFVKPEYKRFIMLLSTKAGGLGLNLTAADTVIIYDSDWNPQNDLQAQARAHRIGQTHSVKIYRLITRKTYEMHMFHRASLKLGLDQAVLTHMRQENEKANDKKKSKRSGRQDAQEIDELLKKGAYDVFREDDSAAEQFCAADIDSILKRSSQIIQYEQEARSTFSKASFVSATTSDDVDIDDPDFWKKAIGLEEPEPVAEEELLVPSQRKRTRVSRFGTMHDEEWDDSMDVGDTVPNDKDEDEAAKREHREWTVNGRERLQRALMHFGFGRWEMIRNQSGSSRSLEDVEEFARAFVLHCGLCCADSSSSKEDSTFVKGAIRAAQALKHDFFAGGYTLPPVLTETDYVVKLKQGTARKVLIRLDHLLRLQRIISNALDKLDKNRKKMMKNEEMCENTVITLSKKGSEDDDAMDVETIPAKLDAERMTKEEKEKEHTEGESENVEDSDANKEEKESEQMDKEQEMVKKIEQVDSTDGANSKDMLDVGVQEKEKSDEVSEKKSAEGETQQIVESNTLDSTKEKEDDQSNNKKDDKEKGENEAKESSEEKSKEVDYDSIPLSDIDSRVAYYGIEQVANSIEILDVGERPSWTILSSWWGLQADRHLLMGVFVHGYGRSTQIFSDPRLYFQERKKEIEQKAALKESKNLREETDETDKLNDKEDSANTNTNSMDEVIEDDDDDDDDDDDTTMSDVNGIDSADEAPSKDDTGEEKRSDDKSEAINSTDTKKTVKKKEEFKFPGVQQMNRLLLWLLSAEDLKRQREEESRKRALIQAEQKRQASLEKQQRAASMRRAEIKTLQLVQMDMLRHEAFLYNQRAARGYAPLKPIREWTREERRSFCYVISALGAPEVLEDKKNNKVPKTAPSTTSAHGEKDVPNSNINSESIPESNIRMEGDNDTGISRKENIKVEEDTASNGIKSEVEETTASKMVNETSKEDVAASGNGNTSSSVVKEESNTRMVINESDNNEVVANSQDSQNDLDTKQDTEMKVDGTSSTTNPPFTDTLSKEGEETSTEMTMDTTSNSITPCNTPSFSFLKWKDIVEIAHLAKTPRQVSRFYVEKFLPKCRQIAQNKVNPLAADQKMSSVSSLGGFEYIDPFENIHLHGIKAKRLGIICLRRMQLLRVIRFILSEKKDELILYLKSKQGRNVEQVPIWWCPWIHDYGLFLGIAKYGIFAWKKIRNDPKLPFSLSNIQQHIQNVFIPEQKSNQSKEDEITMNKTSVVNENHENISPNTSNMVSPSMFESSTHKYIWLRTLSEEFPSAAKLEERIQEICIELTRELPLDSINKMPCLQPLDIPPTDMIDSCMYMIDKLSTESTQKRNEEIQQLMEFLKSKQSEREAYLQSPDHCTDLTGAMRAYQVLNSSCNTTEPMEIVSNHLESTQKEPDEKI